MTNKDAIQIIKFGQSHTLPMPGAPIGVTKFQAFLAIRHMLKDKQYWKALREAYVGTDNLFEYRYDVRYCFSSKEPFREALMNKSEQMVLGNLPQQITIYRGMTKQEKSSNSFGISWTLNPGVAEFYVKTYNRNYHTNHLPKTIHKLTIKKSEVIAYLNGRQEEEIIYFDRPYFFP